MPGANTLTRRTWLLAACAGVLGRRLVSAQSAAIAVEARVRDIIAEYSQQGFHRTGTTVDPPSGEWLFEHVSRMGLKPSRETFTLSRVEPGICRITVGGTPIDGLPLFDGAFTAAEGIRGRLGPIGGDADIGLVAAPPNTASAGPLGDARRLNRHKAILFVTRGGRPGLCPSNADAFLKPFGPPVLQVSSAEWALLSEHAERRSEIHLVATAQRTRSTSFNVIASIPQSGRASLPPLVVMTPRSGWYACASERGGGIACWLEVMRALSRAPLSRAPLRRDVVFVASGGHELGHLGIDAFVANRPGLVSGAIAWMHFGANIGAAVRPDAAPSTAADDADRRHAIAAMVGGNTIQASDDANEAILSRVLTANGIAISRRVPRGTVPGGEAEVVHKGGGKYVSVIGSNALFHNLADAGVETVNTAMVARFIAAFTTTARTLAA